ncbi:related to glycerol-3-phosphate O-acyltransferase (formerly described as CTR1 suppressor) [Lecanosticta acicola]|uniref:Related to glycerol-3-phosphate O-acyltransferase (Formerly described as CTR1 suppressor ) n=1 Tax=Lecanosticta acicola TaxID=111012 RepID=A0AAI8Z9I3_9PEZI|nr:related to glycerol-3-phosphate O-acyltransferase (formerly described as CTR1 suppressor) [Lecanosticta acicola]
MAREPKAHTNNLVYDIFLWIFTVVVDLFFREIHPRSSWKIPKKGPVIFVAAPHANQFVDPLILMRVVRQDAHRRIAFLVAEKSMRRKFIGFAASLVGSVPVGRALDLKKPAPGKIYLPDPEGNPTLIRGNGVNFKSEQFQVGGLVVLPSVNNAAANAEIEEIVSGDELRLKKPFKGDVAYKQLTGKPVEESNGDLANGDADPKSFEGTKFQVAPHVDQGKVYEAVFERVKSGGCIGIFPEGGSHDRTELLPLKAGLAIMALGALAEDPNCGVTVVPVGMNYFHAHKFRSRAVIEFGSPIEIEPHLVEMYKHGSKRDAVGKVLQTVYDRLSAVTVQAPDYDTLMLIQAVRRLYNPKGKKMPLPFVIELNRRLIKGYQTYKNDPRIVHLRKEVLDYNRQLFQMNIRDHQISYAQYPWYWVVFLLVYRTLKLMLLLLVSLPGAILFSPVFILGKIISRQKAKEALAASTVKVKARDVVATWKILVSLALAPALDIFYTSILVSWTWHNRIRGWVPQLLPLWLVASCGLFFFPAICFGALRFGEIGMDIFKSLRPLFMSIHPTQSNTLVKLRKKRAWLQERINDIINELGPELFPDFDQNRIVNDPEHPLHSPSRSRPGTPTHRRDGSEIDSLSFSPASPVAPSAASHNLPRNESFKNISSIGIFASRPGTPNRSRSRSNSHDFRGASFGMTSIDSTAAPAVGAKANLDEVSKNLHEAMRERGRRRKSDAEFEFDRSSEPEETEDFEPEEAKKDI